MKSLLPGLVVIGLLFAYPCFAEETIHKGHPIQFWLEELLSENPQQRELAERELRVIGTNALPTMLSYVISHQSSSINYGSFRILGPTAKPAVTRLGELVNDPSYCSDASMALQLIGPDGVVPLTNSLTNQNPKIRQKIIETLRLYGLNTNSFSAAQAAIPAISKCISDKEPMISAVAMSTLMTVCTNSDQVVQDIMPNLQSESAEIRRVTVTNLKLYGKRAKSAIPGLLKCLNDKDEITRAEAAFAIQAIDPEEAKKAGVKIPIY